MKAFKIALGLVFGLIVGGMVNMSLINLGGLLLPMGDGIDPSNMEHLKAVMPTLELKYFLTPFLAHALGTLCGAIIALWISQRTVVLAYVVGASFFIGGGMMVYMLPESPLWFDIVDLSLAYFPMSWIATKIIKK
jgi:hypothetical protein